MTTVVGLARDGAVWMAADTLTNVYERPIPGAARKILRLPAGGGEILLGITGAGALVGILAAGLKVDGEPNPGQDPQPWAHAVAVAVTELAIDAGITENGKLEGSLLLGWSGQLWTLTHAGAIPHPDGIGALGSGEGPAIGALDALLHLGSAVTGMGWAEMVRAAAEIGCRRDRYSGLPVDVEVLHRDA